MTLRILMLVVCTLPCLAAPRPESCRVLRKHGQRPEAVACFETLAASQDAYLRAEGLWGLDRYKEALQSFDTALAQPGARPLYRVRLGLLFHERFNDTEAVASFQQALKEDSGNAQAYLGLALVSSEGFDAHAKEYVAKAIALDPKLPEAHELAANLALEDAKPEQAVVEADKAIALSPDALDAFAIHAAVALLKDEPADPWLARIAAVNPHYGEGYALVAHHLVLNRRYQDGVAYYRKAIAADPRLWSAHEQLGINLMRLGEEKEPFAELELAFQNGQTDAATSNSLKLLDSYKRFETTRDATTILRLDKKEADLLRPYFEAELHKAIATYTQKYKTQLSGPVQLEVYPDHEDFAVRTMGMPGLGALGVTFGEVVAMDSPSGRKPGEFNWGATLWHEMSHVFILTATNHRVPRWFTEGLAVHEEGAANPAWANRLTPDVVAAIRDHKLLGVADLDRGFIYPEYPAQVIVSYFQAGTICDFINERWGDAALLGMVHSFAERKTTPEAVDANLHITPAQFDTQYAAWLDKRAGATVGNFDRWRVQLKALAALAQAKQNGGVLRAAPEVIGLYPEYVGDANAYEFLAQAQLALGKKQEAAATLSAYSAIGGENPTALKQLATLQASLGHPKDAASTLAAINFIYPEDETLHRELADLFLAQADASLAIREDTAVLALHPLDKAGAEYHLAEAYLAAGDRAKAEESVLASLETAPGFRPAQKLLLQIEAATPKPSTSQ